MFISPDSIIPELYNPQSLNRYAYCINNPLKYTDPTGHDYWLEGPSPNEPAGHISFSVGRPGSIVVGGSTVYLYTSFSYGTNFDFDSKYGIVGEVYRDSKLGGKIIPGTYHKTSREDDDKLLDWLNDIEKGKKGSYTPFMTCRHWSQDAFEAVKKAGWGEPAEAPNRDTDGFPSSSPPWSSSTVTANEAHGPWGGSETSFWDGFTNLWNMLWED